MIEQLSDEWFEKRKGKITGSKVGAILGLSPHNKTADVLRAMVREYHGAPSEFEGNAATGWGNANEAGATLDYELDTGNKVEKAPFVEFRPWLGASPDGYVGTDGLVEIKCPYGKREIEDESEFSSIDDQPHYYAQIQIQLLCTGRQWCDFYQWAPKAQKLERVELDYAWCVETAKKLKEFHELYLTELDNTAHLAPLRKVVDDESAVLLAKEYSQIRAQIKDLESRQKEIIGELSEKHGQCEIDGHKLTEVERQGSISYAKVVRDHLQGLDLEPYRGKTTTHWRLS